jgi:cysteinyl-tRNA synthetase
MDWARSEMNREGSQLSVANTILWLTADQITDEEVNRLIEERNAAKKARDFARSDAIRKQLADAGIVVEDTKDGMRWKRK